MTKNNPSMYPFDLPSELGKKVLDFTPFQFTWNNRLVREIFRNRTTSSSKKRWKKIWIQIGFFQRYYRRHLLVNDHQELERWISLYKDLLSLICLNIAVMLFDSHVFNVVVNWLIRLLDDNYLLDLKLVFYRLQQFWRI